MASWANDLMPFCLHCTNLSFWIIQRSSFLATELGWASRYIMLSFQAFGQMSSWQNVLAPQKMFKCFPADIREPFQRKGRQAHLILKSFALKKYYQPSKEEGKNTRGVCYKTFLQPRTNALAYSSEALVSKKLYWYLTHSACDTKCLRPKKTLYLICPKRLAG